MELLLSKLDIGYFYIISLKFQSRFGVDSYTQEQTKTVLVLSRLEIYSTQMLTTQEIPLRSLQCSIQSLLISNSINRVDFK